MRCRAKSKQSQQRCKRHAIAGGTVCAIHGGKASQVIAAARLRLAAKVDPAIARLEKVIKDPEHEASAVRAAKDVLDRAGLKPTDRLKLETDVEVYDPGREKLSDADLDTLIKLAEKQLASAES